MVGRPLPGFFLLLIIVARFLSPSESRVYSLLNSPPSDQTQSASNGGDQKTHRLLLVFPLKSYVVQSRIGPRPVQVGPRPVLSVVTLFLSFYLFNYFILFFIWINCKTQIFTSYWASNYPLKLFYSLNAITFKS